MSSKEAFTWLPLQHSTDQVEVRRFSEQLSRKRNSANGVGRLREGRDADLGGLVKTNVKQVREPRIAPSPGWTCRFTTTCR